MKLTNIFISKRKKKEEKLLKLYEDGAYLKVGEDIDNKQNIEDIRKNGNKS